MMGDDLYKLRKTKNLAFASFRNLKKNMKIKKIVAFLSKRCLKLSKAFQKLVKSFESSSIEAFLKFSEIC